VQLGTAIVGVTFQLDVRVQVCDIAAVVVHRARLVAFEDGRYELGVTFTSAGVVLAKRTAEFAPNLTLHLGQGIALVAV
jgi:hypothetical protein